MRHSVRSGISPIRAEASRFVTNRSWCQLNVDQTHLVRPMNNLRPIHNGLCINNDESDAIWWCAYQTLEYLLKDDRVSYVSFFIWAYKLDDQLCNILNYNKKTGYYISLYNNNTSHMNHNVSYCHTIGECASYICNNYVKHGNQQSVYLSL